MKEINEMAKLTINGEAAFQVLSHSFSVSPSSEGYTLQYSANGTEWTDYDEPVPADENLVVVNCAFGQYIKLSGNNSEVTVIY